MRKCAPLSANGEPRYDAPMIDEDDVATGEFEAVELDDDGVPVIPRVTDDWFWQLEKHVRELEARTSFEVASSESHRPPPEILKEHLASASGLKQIPETIVSLYDITDGYDLSWRRKNEDDEWVPGGEIHLFGFAEVFGKWVGSLWGEAPEGAEQEALDFSWELRGFDGADPDDERMVVFHVPEVLPRYHLYWHAPRGATYRLRVDFLAYLQCLLETRGLCGWQYMVCELDDLEGDDEALARVRECTSLMRKLFPDVDLSNYTTLDDA